MTRKCTMPLACFFASLLFFMFFTSFAFSQPFLELFLFLSGEEQNNQFTSQINVQFLDSNEKPVGHVQVFSACQGHESDGCVTAGLAPLLLDSSHFVVITENLLLMQNNKPLLQQYNFTRQPDNTVTLVKVRNLRISNRFLLNSNCFHFEFSNHRSSLVFSEILTASDGKVIGKVFNPTTGKFGPSVNEHLPSFPNSQFIACAPVFTGTSESESQMVAGGNGIVTLEIGGNQIPIQLPSGTSISGYAFSRENESSPSLLPTFFYNIVKPRSTGGFASQVFAQKWNPFTHQFEGPVKKITKPAVFNRTEPPSLHPVAASADGKFVGTIGYGRGRFDVIDTVVNPVTAGAVKHRVLTYFKLGDVPFSPVVDTSAFTVP